MVLSRHSSGHCTEEWEENAKRSTSDQQNKFPSNKIYQNLWLRIELERKYAMRY